METSVSSPALNKRPTRHSYSSLKLFKQCPAAYKYSYMQRIPSPSTGAMDRGTRLHKLAEDYMKSTDMPCPYDIKKIGLKIYQLREKGAVAEETWLLDKDWEPTDDESKARLKAIVDVHIPPRTTNVLVLHDYKSGREYPEHADQLELYALTGLRRYPSVVRAEASAIYIDAGTTGPSRSILREMFPKLSRRWTELMDRVDDENAFMPTAGGHCRRCSYRSDNGGPCDAWRSVNE
jgi:hypothetical protein